MQDADLHTTAILVFAQSPEAEIRHKKIAKGEELFGVLNRDVLEMAQRTGLPYFHFSEEQQRGLSFGERFTNAIQHVFDQGFENVIAIGNDTPHLSASHLGKAIALLTKNKWVLGPSVDGGCYLLGLQKSGFDAETFKKLPWQTSGLRLALMTQAMDVGNNIVQLEKLHDIDAQADLRVFQKFTYNLRRSLLNALMSLIPLNNEIGHQVLLWAKDLYFPRNYNKGSPSFR